MTPLDVLKKYWGYDAFRPLQEDIINSVLQGHDTLGLMPTGGGKSITFQVPGILLGGLTLVVTPLISLMKDQVDGLRKRGIKAVYLHSGMTSKETRMANERICNSGCQFLYIAPERLQSDYFLQELRHYNIRLIVADEAHCISQWGYDFRPSYLQINKVRKVLPDVPVMALTATATPAVVEDICHNLEFRDGQVFRKSFQRENIQYIVRPTADKLSETLHILERTQGSAIIYTRSRRRTAEVADFLNTAGIEATYYHAGLQAEEKEIRQNRWSRGEVRVIVATNAFGMGIDKPDVRVVIHVDIPPSLEEYYQEAGRAGRDGLRSYAVLLRTDKDKAILKRRLTEAFPDRQIILKVYERVCNFLNISLGEGYNRIYEFDLTKFLATFEMQEQQVKNSLKILTNAEYLTFIEETENLSRVMIICERETLFHVDMSPKADKVMQLLLRTYSGLFTDYVTFSEFNLARKSGMTVNEVYHSLLELSRLRLIHYVPRKSTPYIFMPTSRDELRYIVIGKAVYEDRKEIMKARLDAVMEYAFSDKGCRVRRMLDYFGEENSRDCGTCDVCLKTRRRAGKIATPSREQLLQALVDYLKSCNNAANMKMILAHFPQHNNLIASLVTMLCDEGFLTCDGEWYSLS
jgi:ATP-dependent DNA helicase RecQ